MVLTWEDNVCGLDILTTSPSRFMFDQPLVTNFILSGVLYCGMSFVQYGNGLISCFEQIENTTSCTTNFTDFNIPHPNVTVYLSDIIPSEDPRIERSYPPEIYQPLQYELSQGLMQMIIPWDHSCVVPPNSIYTGGLRWSLLGLGIDTQTYTISLTLFSPQKLYNAMYGVSIGTTQGASFIIPSQQAVLYQPYSEKTGAVVGIIVAVIVSPIVLGVTIYCILWLINQS